MIHLLAVSLSPTAGGFGASEAQKIANELAGLGLILCLVGWVGGAIVKGFAGGVGNQVGADAGGRWMGRAFIAGVCIAGGAALINFAVLIGSNIH